MNACVVLLSGGLDSATTLAYARRRDGLAVHALSVDYGQRHRAELDAAARVAEQLEAASHKVVRVDLSAFGGSALTDDVPVPTGRSEAEMSSGIPPTYVPARNTVLLSLALAYAETLDTGLLYCGVNAVDYSGYPDCRPAFIESFAAMANLATKAAVEGRYAIEVRTPLMTLDKASIVRLGTSLGVDYGKTVTCYAPAADGGACGECDACHLRRRGFEQAGISDPTRYYQADGETQRSQEAKVRKGR
jgi:7-cyano-7-deazaguanine synthase